MTRFMMKCYIEPLCKACWSVVGHVEDVAFHSSL